MEGQTDKSLIELLHVAAYWVMEFIGNCCFAFPAFLWSSVKCACGTRYPLCTNKRQLHRGGREFGYWAANSAVFFICKNATFAAAAAGHNGGDDGDHVDDAGVDIILSTKRPDTLGCQRCLF